MPEPLRILILEDNPADAELTKFEMEDAGLVFTPKVVMHGEDFIRELEEFSPDLILSDYDLPKYNGTLALAEARKKCPNTPFILVTGAVTEDRAIDILTQGAKDYVLKNRLQQRLVPAIQRALAEAEEIRARKKAEEELREAHRDLETLVEKRTTELNTVLDAAPVGIWIAHDPECKLITGNAYADEIIMKTSRLGNISRSAAPGESAISYKVFHDGVELKPEEMPAQIATATGKPVTEMNVELVFSDGRHAHLIESAVPIFDTDGRVRGAVVTGSDISKLKQSEDTLKHIEERQRLVLQASSLGTFELDLLTGESIWNEAEFKLFGLSPGSPQTGPDTFFRFVHPDDMGMMQDHWEEAKRTGKLDAEFRIVRADGQVRWLAGKGQFFSGCKPEGNDPGARGATFRFMGVNFDITERKRTEDKLRKGEERHRLLAETMLQGVVHQDAKGEIIEMNPSAERILGKNREQFLGSSSVDEEHHTLRENGEQFPGAEHPSIVALQTGLPVKGVVMGVFNPKLSAYRWITIDAVPVFHPGDASPSEVYTVFEDITERKRREEKLQRTLAESEQNSAYLEAVISAQNDVVIMYDGQRNVQRVNPAFMEVYGFNPIGLHVTDIMRRVSCRSLDGRSLVLDEQPTPQALSGKKVAGLCLAVTRADGSDGIVEVSSGPIQQKDRIIGAVTVWHDITKLTMAEEALVKSLENCRKLVEKQGSPE